MRRILILYLLANCYEVVRGQTDSTAWRVGLDAFEVVHRSPVPVEELTASISVPDSTLLMGFERSSLRSALVWLPGVQMDERGHGGSTRLSIRGSLLRAPYGVRGVKVYLGPFPLTLADGSTPLELLDPLLTDEVRVERRIGSALYGSAPAGLVLAGLVPREAGEWGVQAEALGGPFGFHRIALRGGAAEGRSAIEAGLVRQRNDGYRDQEYSARDQAFLSSRWSARRSSGQVLLTWQHGTWGLPGALDSLTAANAPRSARPYAQAIDAHVDKQQVLAGIAVESRLGGTAMLRSAIHAQRIDKRNPYGNSAANSGDKDETITAVGARLGLSGRGRKGRLRPQWEVGLEALAQRDLLDEHSFREAVPDTLRSSSDTRVGNLNVFAHLTLPLGNATQVVLAAGSERTVYDHRDLLRATEVDRSLGPALLPAVEVGQRLPGGAWSRLRYAGSVSRPTVWELLGADGQFNTELRPERVRELQFDLSAGHDTTVVLFGLSVYRRWVNGLIVLQPGEADGPGNFVNAGNAVLDGVEVHTRARGRSEGGTDLLLEWTFTLQDHRVRREPGSAEHVVPGVPPLQTGLRLRLAHESLGHAEFGVRYVAHVPACLGCGDEVPDATLGHLRLAWVPLKGLELFLHVENLFDVRYTAFVQVDDPGRRYYNPAPVLGYYAGIRFLVDQRTARN